MADGKTTYKEFEDEKSFNDFKGQVFSKGYNEGKEKGEKRNKEILSELSSELDTSFDSFDELRKHVSDLSEQVSSGEANPTQSAEYKELHKGYKELKAQNKELAHKNKEIDRQYEIDRSIAKGLASVNGDTVLDHDDLETLFKKKYKSKKTDNGLTATKDGKPVMDDEGNYKPLNQIVSDFANSYIKNDKQGTGGGTGGEVTPSKPDFQAYKQAKRDGNYQKQQELVEQSEQAGGWENAPASLDNLS